MAALKSAKIIGDIVDDVQHSEVKLQVKYGDTLVHDGVTLPPDEVCARVPLQVVPRRHRCPTIAPGGATEP